MDIFNDELAYEDIDFDYIYNEDCEQVLLGELTTSQLISLITHLEREIRMMPEHENIMIWKEYYRRCKALREENL